MSETRTKRSISPTHQLTDEDRNRLAQIYTHPGYQVLLDVMEQVCAVQETRLINAEVKDARAILAEHRKTQAAWQIFAGMQERVTKEMQRYNSAIVPAAADEFLSEHEEEVLEVTNPVYESSRQP